MKYIIFLFIILFCSPCSVLAEGKSTLENRVERLERYMDPEKQLELLHRVNQLQQENQQLRGLLEEQNHQLQALKSRQRELYRDINLRYNKIEKGDVKRSTTTSYKTSTPASTAAIEKKTQPSVNTPVSVVTDSGVEIIDKSIQVNIGEPVNTTQIQRESITVAPTSSKDQRQQAVYVAKPMSAKERQAEQQAYQRAYDELRAQHYVSARNSFSAFINQYPHGRYAHIAQYWIAESSYAQKDYQQAILDYQHLIDFYPNSPKRAEAQLKKAYCYDETGNKESARKTLQQLMAQYPDTTEASQAKQLLKNL